MRIFLPFLALAVGLAGQPETDRATANDNRIPGGKLQNGVLTLQVEAKEVMWRPFAEDAGELQAFAFAEVGKPAQIPGPLLRVSAGTEVRLSVRNTFPRVLQVRGLFARPVINASDTLPVEIAPGETRDIQFKLDAPGTYMYWGSTAGGNIGARRGADTQLSGAIVVDEAGASAKERVFVITQWIEQLNPDGTPNPNLRLTSAINGKAWPHTERFKKQVGESTTWRWVNASGASHPMHLHGFYFAVDARGDLRADTAYASDATDRVVTERMNPAATMRMTWVPERAGNWLFHCHIPGHVRANQPLPGAPLLAKASGHHANHTIDEMGGLMLGVEVTGGSAARATTPRRRLRLLVQSEANSNASVPAYRFVLDGPDALARRGIGRMMNPVLLARRGEPLAITVVNQLSEPTAIHWHGIELESYYDGVPGFGGIGTKISPVIEPHDSFVVQFTPPRAGTFMYHTHVDERRQERAGLNGMLLVVDRDGDFDAPRDHQILFSTVRAAPSFDFYINNQAKPDTAEWSVGRHRVRFANLTIAPPAGIVASLRQDTTTLQWRPVAKDAAIVPKQRDKMIRAIARFAPGETGDFEVVISEPGDYILDARVPGAATNPNAPRNSLPIRVR